MIPKNNEKVCEKNKMVTDKINFLNNGDSYFIEESEMKRHT